MYRPGINLLVSFIFSGSLFLISCKKSDQPASVVTLITGTKWHLDALYIIDSPYVQRTNFTTQYYSPCEISDVYEFKTDSTLSRKRIDTATTCTPLSHFMPDDGATWYLDSADTHLIIYKQSFFNPYLYNCKILKLDKNSLELQSNFRNYFDQPSAYIFSFRAK